MKWAISSAALTALLPYGKEIDRCATEGGMFQAIKYCNPKYTASLNKVLDALEQMELAEAGRRGRSRRRGRVRGGRCR